MKEIFGKMFTMKLMANVHLRLYNFVETEDQIHQKKDFKSELSHYYRDKFENTLKYQPHLDKE